MKKLLLLFLLIPTLAFSGEPIQLARMNPYVAGAGVPAAGSSCTTSNDTALFDYTADSPGGTHNVYGAGPGAQKFTFTGTKTITEYKIYLADVNNEGSITVALYTDNANATGSIVDGTTVTIAASEIAAGPGVITFTLSTPKTGLAAGTYWLYYVGSGAGTPGFTVSFVSKAGSRIRNESTYFDDYAHLTGVWGCTE